MSYLCRKESISIVALIIGMLVALSSSNPLKSRAADWLTSGDSRSYSHIGGGSKFSKGPFLSQPPRSPNTNSLSKGSRSGNTTLAAILLFAVLGVGATVFFVVVCSKMTTREKYNTVEGSVK